MSANNLYKKDVFRLPDPFAVITVNGQQTHSTSVVKKTLNPYWNESFDLTVQADSILTIQLFDQRKWKKDRNQGFMGVINLPLAGLLESDEILKLELKKSNSSDAVSGTIDIRISPASIDVGQGPSQPVRPSQPARTNTLSKNTSGMLF